MTQENIFRRGRAWIELDRAALENNVAVFRARLPGSCALMPAVKANAYGHGAAQLVPELVRLGVRDFCVATAQEGAEVRSLGAEGTVLVLGYTAPELFPLLREHDLTQAAVDFEYARELAAARMNLRAHLAVDTGMHRLGVEWTDFEQIAAALELDGARFEGLFTHLCCAEDEAWADSGFTLFQLGCFEHLKFRLYTAGFSAFTAHALNSGGCLTFPEYAGDFARPGIALYGVLGTAEDTRRLGPDLLPVLSLRARVASVKTLPAGERAGYGLDFHAGRKSTLAVLTIGYADGLPRCLSGGVGRVLINGRSAPIAGRICMDQTLVDVTDIPGVRAGDAATLIGRDGDESISVFELAEKSGSITNEILSRLSTRLERVLV